MQVFVDDRQGGRNLALRAQVSEDLAEVNALHQRIEPTPPRTTWMRQSGAHAG